MNSDFDDFDEPDRGKFPDIAQTLAMGFALGAMVGGLYMFSASYPTPGEVALAYHVEPMTSTATVPAAGKPAGT